MFLLWWACVARVPPVDSAAVRYGFPGDSIVFSASGMAIPLGNSAWCYQREGRPKSSCNWEFQAKVRTPVVGGMGLAWLDPQSTPDRPIVCALIDEKVPQVYCGHAPCDYLEDVQVGVHDTGPFLTETAACRAVQWREGEWTPTELPHPHRCLPISGGCVTSWKGAWWSYQGRNWTEKAWENPGSDGQEWWYWEEEKWKRTTQLDEVPSDRPLKRLGF